MDYRKLFSRTLYEEIVSVFDEHGIDWMYEDELESVVKEAEKTCYYQSIAEFRKRHVPDATVPKIRLW